MAVAELFANQSTTTVSSGGTDAPSSGTSQSWTVASSSSFPAAVTGTSQFHIVDTASSKVSEIIAVTNVSGTTWTVTRGAESTTPVAHASGFTVMQTTTAGSSSLTTTSTATLALSQTAVQASAYTASANQLVPVSTASGAVTVTLPNAPAGGTLVGVKLVTLGTGNAVTVACAGSDVFNKSGGGTSATLSLQSQGVLLEYNSGIWLVLSDDLPLTQLEALFLQAANNLSDVAGKAAAYNNISPMTTAGDTVYGGTSGAGTRLAGNTSATKNFLAQTGTGSASAAPAWGAIASGDLPAATTSAQGAVKLDGTAGDIQPVGTAGAAGSAGQAADAGHVHKGFAKLATTGTAGFALQNATPSIITWTAPSDSAIHMFVCISVAHVTSTETGGVVQVVYESPVSGAGNHFSQILAGGLSTDTNGQTGTTIFALVQPGTTVTVEQTSALTAGAATVYAELWGS